MIQLVQHCCLMAQVYYFSHDQILKMSPQFHRTLNRIPKITLSTFFPTRTLVYFVQYYWKWYWVLLNLLLLISQPSNYLTSQFPQLSKVCITQLQMCIAPVFLHTWSNLPLVVIVPFGSDFPSRFVASIISIIGPAHL